MTQNEQQMTESLKEIQGWVQQGGEFVTKQAPQIANEMLTVGFWTAFASAILIFLVLLLGVGFLTFWTKRWKLDKIDTEEYTVVFAVFMLVELVLTIPFFVQIYYMVYITFAPRVYILEQLGKLIS